MELITAVLFLLAMNYDVTSSADCSGLPDGTYMIDCYSYYICQNHTSTEHTCQKPPAEKIVFNSITGKCDKLVNVASPCGDIYFDCSNKGDRDYANLATNCTTFAVCYGGKLSGYHKCPGVLVFHEDIQTCDWVAKVPPPCGTKV